MQELIDFVEGRMSGEALAKLVLEGDYLDSVSEQLLSAELRLRLLAADYSSAADLYAIQGLLADALDHFGVTVKESPVFKRRYVLLQSVKPEWADVRDTEVDPIVAEAEAAGLAGKGLRQAVKSRIASMFRYVGKPPTWIQSPEWPRMASGRPMLFLGQIDVPETELPGAPAVYVFYDTEASSFTVVSQT